MYCIPCFDWFHHHHHHVHEGLGMFPVPWSSRCSWFLHLFLGRPTFLRPFGLYCSACFGSLFVSILCMCCTCLIDLFIYNLKISQFNPVSKQGVVFSMLYWILQRSERVTCYHYKISAIHYRVLKLWMVIGILKICNLQRVHFLYENNNNMNLRSWH